MSTARRLWHILAPASRRAALALSVLMLFGMLLETLGVGAIVPAISLLTSSTPTARFPSWLAPIGAWSPGERIVWAMFVLLGIYVVKAGFLAMLAWRQAKFAFAVQSDVSKRLFSGYLNQPWTFHLQRNSAQLLRNTTTEVSNLSNVIQSCLTIATEGSVLVGLTALLLVVEPVGSSVVIGALGVAAWLFHASTRSWLLAWGEARHRHDGYRLQHLQQGLGGVKDAKLLGREENFLAQFDRHNQEVARMGRRQFTLQQMPRLWLELLAVLGLAALVTVMVGRGRPADALLPTLALFAAAAFRLMPSVVRIMNAAQLIRYNLAAIDTLDQELRLVEQSDRARTASPFRFESAIVLDHVHFQYATAAAPALVDVSLAIRRGTSVGFVGGSGAGKSTLVDVILGLLSPSSGRIFVDGADIATNLRGWQDQIGYVPQSIFLTDDSIRRNVAFGLADDLIDDAAVWRAVRSAQLDQFVNGLPAGLQTVVGERGVQLSGGQRQRIGIARALYHDPAVVVLDEATSALDHVTEQGIMDAVQALHGSKTFLIVAHRLSTIEHCDVLFRLDSGKLVEASTSAGRASGQ